MAKAKTETVAPKKKKRGQGDGSFYQMKNGTWCGRLTVGYDDNGKQKRKAFYGKTKIEVQKKMNEAKVALDKGIYVEPSNMTVAEWMDTWLLEYKKNSIKPKTYFGYCGDVRRYTKPLIGKYKLKDLRNDIIQKFINDLISRGLSTLTIRNVFATLKAALQQATINEIIAKNVAVGIQLPKLKTKDIRVLSTEEQERFVQVSKNTSKGEIFLLCLGTGLRIGELMALTWDNIDFDACLLKVNKNQIEIKDLDDPNSKFHIEVNTPKSKSSFRTIPLLPSIITMLKELKKSQEEQKLKLGSAYLNYNLVFCAYNGNHIFSDYMRKVLKNIAQNAKIDDLHIHCLRHTFATRCLEQGIELKVVQELLGHSSIKMTADIYTHVMPDKKRDSIMKLEDTLNI